MFTCINLFPTQISLPLTVPSLLQQLSNTNPPVRATSLQFAPCALLSLLLAATCAFPIRHI
jgi:hypothetical protein